MKTFPILLILLACITFGCDPGVQYSRLIKNNSSYEICIIKKNYPLCDTTTISLGQEHIVYQRSGLGSTSAYEDCNFENPSSDTFLLIVKDNPGLSVKADVTGNANWFFTKTKKGPMGGGVCNCRLTITDDLIQ